MYRALLAAALLGLAAWGQKVQVERPWLSAYDPQGNLLWELRAAEVEGTAAGWRARDVTVVLYAEGSRIEAQAEEVQADPKGTEWRAPKGIRGQGEGFTFAAAGASWREGKLSLTGLELSSGDLSLRAARATWEGGSWRLTGVEARFGDWEISFSAGVYLQRERVLRVPGRLTARGWGWEISAAAAEIDVDAGTVTLKEVEVGPA